MVNSFEIQLLQVIAAFEQISCPKEEENLDFGVKKERVYAETLSISLDISHYWNGPG